MTEAMRGELPAVVDTTVEPNRSAEALRVPVDTALDGADGCGGLRHERHAGA